MALSNPVMIQNGATDERGTRSVITTCAAGAKRDAVIVLKEIVEDRETVQRLVNLISVIFNASIMY